MPDSTRNPWLLAARPATLWAAVAPVAVGAGLAVGDRVFRPDAFLAALVGALAIQVAANFANDASDARRGADTEDRIGPTRVVAAGLLTSRQVWRATGAALGVAVLAGIYLTIITSWVIVAIGLASIVATLTYVGGPIPYGYRGLGEVFVFVFFGVVATVGSRFVHDESAPADAWLLAIPIGFTVTAVLVANNVRDIETDRQAGKRTLAVLLGPTRSRRLFATLVYGTFAVVAGLAAGGMTPPWTAIALAAFPLGIPLVRTLSTAADGPSLIGVLVGTARLHVITGVLLAVGAALG